jgi:hypothetical protein
MQSGPMLTEEQRKALCNLLFEVLVEIRNVAGGGQPDSDCVRASELADAVHNLPLQIFGIDGLEITRNSLRWYQSKYPGGRDYVVKLDAIIDSTSGS